jgi:hypothetical protein
MAEVVLIIEPLGQVISRAVVAVWVCSTTLHFALLISEWCWNDSKLSDPLLDVKRFFSAIGLDVFLHLLRAGKRIGLCFWCDLFVILM